MGPLHPSEADDLEDFYDCEDDELKNQKDGCSDTMDICGSNDREHGSTSADTFGNKYGLGMNAAGSSVALPRRNLDLLDSITGMYRILDLINEQGSGGTVDKVIIAQNSLRQFIDTLCPKAYVSFTRINFKALDKLSVKPIGVYGSKEAIIKLLSFLSAIDSATAHVLGLKTEGSSGVSLPTLRSGLYIVRSFNKVIAEEQLFIIYWPEDTTWDDDAASSVRRNRVTFMRYLTKITDQIVVLISPEHSKAMVWNHDSEDVTMDVDGDDESDRLFTFEIAKTNEQEENVTTRSGFNITCRPIVVHKPPPEFSVDAEVLVPRLLMGETTQAFMSARYVLPTTKIENMSGTKNEVQLRALLRAGGIRLNDEWTNSQVDVLIKCGLKDRFPQECNIWQRSQEDLRKTRDTAIRENEAKVMNILKEEEPNSLSTLTQIVVDEVLRLFPTLTREDLEIDLPVDDGFYKDHFSNMRLISAFANCFDNAVQKAGLESISHSKFAAAFKVQKLRLITAKLLLYEFPGPGEVPNNIIPRIMDGSVDVVKPDFKQQFLSWFSTTGSVVEKVMKESRKINSTMTDPHFLSSLDDYAQEPLLHDAVLQVTIEAHHHFRVAIRKLCNDLTHRFQSLQEDAHKKQIRREATAHEEEHQAVARLELIQQIEKSSRSDDPSRVTVLDSLKPKSTYGYNCSYEVRGHQECRLDPAIEYKVYSLEMSADHQERLRLDHTFTPSPHVEPRRSISFHLPVDYRILHIQLLENNRCLLVVDDSRGNVLIFCDKLSAIDAAITSRRHRKLLHRDKIGQDFLLAFDEAKRMLAICSSPKLQLHIFVFGDDTFTSLQALGSAVSLAPWYTNPTSICHLCFVCGNEEVLLVDASAQARIFSLITQQFRPASLDFKQIPTAIYSSPDGSCLITSNRNNSGLFFRAYHWSTFGSTEGILLEFQDLPDSPMVLSSLLNRSNVHLIGLDVDAHQCRSFALDITSKVTQFTFQEKGDKSASKSGSSSTVHNSLIDCHAEVWTRFPVQPAIRRQTITSSSQRLPKTLDFITDRDHDAFVPHFSELIQSFERTTRKPTGDELKDIRVGASNFDTFIAGLPVDSEWPVTCFKAGEWLVDLLCLIPIHIAITRENRFVPLKDGVYSAELEKQLLGAEVSRIVDSLSFGWYESIFQSYMATKPVKVVSSMGEQSVGKSFALNHLVDTSFAGSAMRTTEGVWMSVAPTEEALVVALDFEGVDSLERSAQEDTFLVLFNTAISNLVLFRNNFTFSRDISGLFQSFQSSSTVLNPAANPSLFQSTLVIIIKDVVDSDKMEIKREFTLKFQKIVQDEQDANFISRLHGGKLNIIPWPVIESRQFYTLFPTLKRRLDHQKITHPAAGEFLHTLKILMAKLKANDWGALSQTLTAHRAQRLLSLLPNALAFGSSEMEQEIEPLKNLDTDAVIDAPDTPSHFYLSGLGSQSEERELALAALRQSWDRHQFRQNQSEHEWTAELSAYLAHLVDMRVDHVRDWISSNLSRFKTNHANIEALRRKFESDVVDLKANIQLCKMPCGSCHLLCLRSRHHEGPHECQTSHECIHPCDFSNEHQEEERRCGFSAGHSGRHICIVRNHLCGEPCKLYGKPGCLERCTEVIGHIDNDHSCSATLHACGEPCDLRQATLTDGQEYSCSGTCTIPVHDVHDRHYCDDRMCPVPCQLCRRLCSDQDHLHALETGAVHLCGQEHDCRALCAANGICEIDTAPQSIEATFTGRHETFQYTKYSQVAKRLPCVIPIDPGTTAHAGSHRHSVEQNSFHFCETRCESCGYFCILPLGHTQQEHETSHGSMSRTRWTVDGPHGTILELNNRKFASDDDGAPMMCNIVCQAMGRHVHVDYCRAEPGVPCQTAETQHIAGRLLPHPDRSKDWVTHSLYWRRTGFRDPYSREDQTNFAKCDAMCSGPEHSATATNPAQPSYCTLPLFHDPHPMGRAAHGGMGYISNDGHSFSCKNPAMLQQAFHVIFVIDRSGSMGIQDRRPLGNTPVTAQIAQRSNNRLGAVYSALQAFWSARQAVLTSGQAAAARRDAYSVLLFDHEVSNCVTNDFTSSAEQLLNAVLTHQARGGTNYTAALMSAQTVMQQHWSTERTPVVIFLSDGECSITDQTVQDICRTAVACGKPLSFHSVSFGPQTSSASLRRMVQIALEFQNNAPRDPLTPAAAVVTSSYSEALDTVRLAETFLGIAESLSKPRGSLIPNER